MGAYPWITPNSEIEKVNKENMLDESLWLGGKNAATGTIDEIKDRADVFPGVNVKQEVFKRFPPTILFTSEYDVFGRSTELFAKKLYDAGV